MCGKLFCSLRSCLQKLVLGIKVRRGGEGVERGERGSSSKCRLDQFRVDNHWGESHRGTKENKLLWVWLTALPPLCLLWGWTHPRESTPVRVRGNNLYKPVCSGIALRGSSEQHREVPVERKNISNNKHKCSLFVVWPSVLDQWQRG